MPSTHARIGSPGSLPRRWGKYRENTSNKELVEIDDSEGLIKSYAHNDINGILLENN